ncbi:SDR family NAD(P)-dependent oxidoreductase [Bradyrhizobium sp. 2TAF24]|uniref:SDR family NAD(P)-dependent oxidoreductase n=1 Tax=Bradyrhizobium sp. 2TAF24 TaxID=3233011 RepID=UPI003F91F590
MSGTVAMITGAAGNLGRAVAHVFAESGARLILVDASLSHLRTAFPDAPAGWQLAEVDLTRRDAAQQRLGEAIAAAGRLDALCAIAGGFRMGEAVHETSPETWKLMMDVNVQTLLNTAHAAVPAMLAQGRGRIVTVGAASARQGLAAMGAYTAAKSAVMRLTEAMAAELGPRGINVNGVLPSVIDTPQNRAAMPDADPAAWVKPADLAAVIRFLASDAAVAINGALIPVNGRG